MKLKKIAILLPNLRIGGAERVAVNLANAFAHKNYAVDIVLLSATGELLSELRSEIRIVDLQVKRLRGVLFPMVRYLRQTQPNALLACMWPLTVIALWARNLACVPTRIVISDHNQISMKPEAKGLFGTFPIRFTMRLAYPFADAIVCVSKGVSKDIAALSGMSLDSLNVIYNPAARGELLGNVFLDEAISPWLKADHRVIVVGSLNDQKDHSLLVHSFAKLVKSTNAKLLIFGEGQLRPKLERLVKQLGLDQQVFMPGFVQDPYPYYLAADLFVLTSQYEGFGNVIVEAMECGLPVVSTDCESGPREILDHGRYGKLVPVGDADALAAAMLAALKEAPNPERQKARASEFSIEKAAQSYLALLDPEGETASNVDIELDPNH